MTPPGPSDTSKSNPSPEAALAPTLPRPGVLAGASEPHAVDPTPETLGGERYRRRSTLGEGGMGEVFLCRDGWLGRDVAMKAMRRSEAAEAWRTRFLREARVQGQLEHPGVVPVYDLAIGAEGAPYFTMKRIAGLTLRDVLAKLARGDAPTQAAFSRRKLLSALEQVCQAVAYAHVRGVIHRDLKPENIMLGSFGEIYVLDWGIARLTGADITEAPIESVGASIEGGATVAGSVVGTPGYMSPEQVRAEGGAVGERSDVYALGCILFEILTLEPLHRAQGPALLVSALTGDGERPSARRPDLDVPVELDAMCARATLLDPAGRFADAREVALAIERFLDGERDEARRKDLADGHLVHARDALERAARGGADEDRAAGIRSLGRALALDPTNRSAMELVTRIVMAAPGDLPPAAERELEAVEIADRASGARRNAVAYLSWGVLLPLLPLLGIRSWPVLGALAAAVVATISYAYWMASTGNAGPRFMRISMVANFAVASLLSAFFGPLFVVPGVASQLVAAFFVSTRAGPHTRLLLGALALASVLLPASLEWIGVVPRSYAFQNGELRILPRLMDFPEIPATLFLVAIAVVQIVSIVVLVGHAIDQVMKAERKNFAQAYRLRQLLPA